MPHIAVRAVRKFPAMGKPNFRLYFYGQLISFAGTVLQMAAEGWLVWDITKSMKWSGIIASMMFLPGMFISPIGGMLVDKFDKKKVIYWTCALAMVQSAIFGILVITGYISKEHPHMYVIVCLALFLGIIQSVNSPAIGALMIETIHRRKQTSARGIHGSLVMMGQITAPIFVAFLIPLIGTGPLFLLNTLSFIPVIITVQKIKLKPMVKKEIHPWRMMVEVKDYIKGDRELSIKLFILGLFTTLAFANRSLLPAISVEIFGRGVREYGIFLCAIGIGSLIASLTLSTAHKQFPVAKTLCLGSVLVGLGLIGVAHTQNVVIGCLFFIPTGAGFVLGVINLRSSIIGGCTRAMQGRMTGFDYGTFFAGMTLGNLIIGLVADKLGCRETLTIFGSVIIFFGFMILLTKNSFEVTKAK